MTRRKLLFVVLVRFLSLFTLMAVQIASDKTSWGVPSDSWLSQFNQKSRQIASSFEQVRNSCEIVAIISRWNCSWFTRAILKLQLLRDKNCIELSDKNRLCKRVLKWQGFFVSVSVSNIGRLLTMVPSSKDFPTFLNKGRQRCTNADKRDKFCRRKILQIFTK